MTTTPNVTVTTADPLQLIDIVAPADFGDTADEDVVRRYVRAAQDALDTHDHDGFSIRVRAVRPGEAPGLYLLVAGLPVGRDLNVYDDDLRAGSEDGEPDPRLAQAQQLLHDLWEAWQRGELASSVRIASRRRELNARGRGSEVYRMARVDDRLVWADKHPRAIIVKDTYPRCPLAKAFRASERKGVTMVELPEGALILEISISVADGRKGEPSYRVGWTSGRDEAIDWGGEATGVPVRHVGVRRGELFVHVIEIDGERVELAS